MKLTYRKCTTFSTKVLIQGALIESQSIRIYRQFENIRMNILKRHLMEKLEKKVLHKKNYSMTEKLVFFI